MKKLFSFVLVAVAALCVATNVYAIGGEGQFNLNGDSFASFRDLYNYVNTLDIRGREYYTEGSWETYANAKSVYDRVVVEYGLVSPDTGLSYTDEELEDFKADLLEAVNGLTAVADYSVLDEQIEKYESLNGDLYTDASWDEATISYNTAVALIRGQARDDYQSTINRAYLQLRNALNGLVEVNLISEELIKHDEIVADQTENGTYTDYSYGNYTAAVKSIVEYLGDDYDTADYTEIHGITRGNDVDVEYAHQLFEARAQLVRINGTVPVLRPSTDVADLPPIPNTADAVVSYIIMMVMGIAGITVFGKKLASSK